MSTRNGKTARELANELGVSMTTIYRRTGASREEYLAQARANRVEAVRLQQDGMSYRGIATEMNVPYDTAYSLVQKGLTEV